MSNSRKSERHTSVAADPPADDAWALISVLQKIFDARPGRTLGRASTLIASG